MQLSKTVSNLSHFSPSFRYSFSLLKASRFSLRTLLLAILPSNEDLMVMTLIAEKIEISF